MSATMQQGKSRIGLTVLLLCLAIAVSLGLFFHKVTSRVMSPDQLRVLGAYVFDKPRSFTIERLQSHDGKEFSLENLKGQWSLIFFGYTYCPDVCPATLALLRESLKQMKEAGAEELPQVILVTVDPARDTIEKLAGYVTFFNPEFIGVTGEFLDLQQFASQVNIAFQKQPGGGENYLVDHSATVAMINPKGHYHGFLKPPFVAEHIATAITEIQRQFPE